MFSLRNSLAVDQRLAGHRYSGCCGYRSPGGVTRGVAPSTPTNGVWSGLGEQERLAILVDSPAAPGVHHPVA
jgi:hypothetical protein